MIEVMVSAVILLILAMATFSLIDDSSKSSSASRSRGVASGLAQADQDNMRQMPIADLASYHLTQTQQVAGVTYTVVSSANWVRDSTGVVTCGSGTARTEYAQITSSVTWPNMNNIRPVTVVSNVAPGVAAISNGALTVKLVDGTTATNGTPGVNVTAGGITAPTDNTGCVVFNNLAPGATNVEWNTPGYVNFDGAQDIVSTPTISTAQTSQINDNYDRAGAATFNFVDEANVAAMWNSVTLTQTKLTNGVRVLTTPSSAMAATLTSATIFPFASSYSAYAGSCAGNNPSNAAYTNGTLATSFVMPRAGAWTGNIALQNLTVNVAGAPASGGRVRVYPSSDPPMLIGCGTAAVATATLPASGIVKIPLPYGSWKLCADYGASAAKNATVTTKSTSLTAIPPAVAAAVNTPSSVTGAYANSNTRNLTLPAATTGGAKCA